MVNGVFHNGLEDEAGDIKAFCGFFDVLFHIKIIASAVFHNRQVIVHIVQLIRQLYQVFLCVHCVLQQAV